MGELLCYLTVHGLGLAAQDPISQSHVQGEVPALPQKQLQIVIFLGQLFFLDCSCHGMYLSGER